MDEDHWLPKGKGGKWETRAVQIGLMLMWQHPDLKEFGGPKCTQFGYSEIASGIAMWLIEQGVANAYFLPDNKLARRHSNQTIKHWVRTHASLSRLLVCGDVDKQHPTNTTELREFTTGSFYCLGAATPSNTAVFTVFFIQWDEPNRTKENIGGEGGLLGLARGRFASSPLGGRIRLFGSPTVPKATIETYIDGCEHVMECFLPCPLCDEYSTLHWGDKDDPYGVEWDDLPDFEASGKTVRHRCRHCNECWTQDRMDEITPRCEWRSVPGNALQSQDGFDPETYNHYWFDTSEEDGDFKQKIDGKWQVVKPPARMGVQLCHDGMGMYGETPWSEAVRVCREATRLEKMQGDISEIQPFENTFRGITHLRTAATEVATDELFDRREIYPHRIPAAIQSLTLGADFGGKYSKYQIDGHGANGERWGIELRKIDGDREDPQSAMYAQLDRIMSAEYEREDGEMLTIDMSILDGRYSMDKVKLLAAKDPTKRIVVLGDGKNLRRATFDFDKDRDWSEEDGCFTVTINPNKASGALYHKLRQPLDSESPYHIPKSIRQEDGSLLVLEDFNRVNLKEMTADKAKSRKFGNGWIVGYEKEGPHVDNESHDTAKYNGIALTAATKHGPVVIDDDYVPKKRAERIAVPTPSPEKPPEPKPGEFNLFGNL